jgi:hypothetical protein
MQGNEIETKKENSRSTKIKANKNQNKKEPTSKQI